MSDVSVEIRTLPVAYPFVVMAGDTITDEGGGVIYTFPYNRKFIDEADLHLFMKRKQEES